MNVKERARQRERVFGPHHNPTRDNVEDSGELGPSHPSVMERYTRERKRCVPLPNMVSTNDLIGGRCRSLPDWQGAHPRPHASSSTRLPYSTAKIFLFDAFLFPFGVPGISIVLLRRRRLIPPLLRYVQIPRSPSSTVFPGHTFIHLGIHSLAIPHPSHRKHGIGVHSQVCSCCLHACHRICLSSQQRP